ncbi:MAG: tRNA (adenosine(37)-N6)-threonylcarbamoyltransferase complex dimerization subunit type 1 TsaB [Candidatus Onthovivens sp.]|nr:tRNA (adenosine(37)-N6)-threonylcarbamoyltransferase complex dimerization subunit type 1 TsaB [Candidatus Onthovivens sp.]
MKTLLLDSSNTDLNVGLAEDGKIIDEISYSCWQRQSEKMIPEIESMLKKHSINPKEITDIAVTIGPGSYTGLRIALTIAKTYCYALQIPCYAISSLQVLSKKDIISICLINARSNRSYFGVYLNGSLIEKDCVKTNEEVIEYIKEHPDYVVCGDTSYLQINGYKSSVVTRLEELKSSSNLVKDLFSLKAIYLKD